jgi:hypothetical protein
VSKTTSSQIIETVTDRLCSALARHKYFLLTFFSILYFGTTCYRASRKLFWFDELFTIYLSRLPDARSVWNALTHGVDFNPPLLYGLTHYSEAVFGQGELAARAPEILSFWIFCLCLFCFVSRRTSALGGFISMLFPLVTTAYWYAYEARAHSLVLAGCRGSIGPASALDTWAGRIGGVRHAQPQLRLAPAGAADGRRNGAVSASPAIGLAGFAVDYHRVGGHAGLVAVIARF